MQAGILSFILGLGLVAVAAGLGPAVLRVRGALAYAVAAGVIAAADVVLVATATSLFDAFTEGRVLAGHALVAAIVGGAWLLTGRPRPPRPQWPTRAQIRAEPLVAGFAAVMAVALAIQLFQGLTVVSNSWDIMAYHLSRAAHWVQQNAVAYFEGGNARQLGYPPNGEILQAWTMRLAGGDALVNVVQWLALLGTGAAVALGARILRFGRPASLLAALLFMAMPIPILQAATAQNDLILTFFLAAGTVFGVRGLRDGHLGEASVGAMGIALALGTKGIVLVAGPSLLLLAGAILWTSPAARRVVLPAAGVFVVAVAALAAYWFVLNLQETDDLYGGARAGIERTSSIPVNHGRVYWAFAETTGIELTWLQHGSDRLGRAVLGDADGRSYALETWPHEAHSAFGMVGFLVLLPIVLLTAFRRRSPPDRRILAIAVLLFFLIFPLSAQDDPSLARLAAPGIALAAPLLAVLHGRRLLSGTVVALALVGLTATVLDNPLRPLIVPRDGEPAFAMSRTEQFMLNRPDVPDLLRRTEALLAPDARIAFVGGHSGYEYPLFGPGLERHVTRMGDSSSLTLESMRERGFDAAVIDGYDGAEPPPGLRALKVADRWWIVLPERGR